METADIRTLVEQVLAQVLREQGLAGGGAPRAAPASRRPLILMTGSGGDHAEILHQLHRLHGEFGPARAVLSETFCEEVAPEAFSRETGIADLHRSLTPSDAEALVDRSSLLLVGSLSANSRSKIAAGICDSLPTRIWRTARDAHLPLFVAEPSPPLAPPPLPHDAPTRRRQREEAMSILRADGAEVIPAAEVFERIQRHLLERGDPAGAQRLREAGPRTIITVEDVDRAHRRGMALWELPADAIVTMAAHDRARDLGLELRGGNIP
jgi:hypothetical protein